MSVCHQPGSAWRKLLNSREAEADAIQGKIARLQQIAHDLVDHGRDPHAVRAVLESFQSEVAPLINTGKVAEAGAAIDRAIARLQAQR